MLNKFNYFIINHVGKYIVPSHDFDDLIQHGFLSIIKAVYLYKLGSSNFATNCTNAIINNYKALLKGHIKHFRAIQNEAILSLKEIIEPERIVYTDYFSDAEGNLNDSMPSTDITMEFIDLDGKTKLINRSEYVSVDALKTVMEKK